jgi:hypothetical protein
VDIRRLFSGQNRDVILKAALRRNTLHKRVYSFALVDRAEDKYSHRIIRNSEGRSR